MGRNKKVEKPKIVNQEILWELDVKEMLEESFEEDAMRNAIDMTKESLEQREINLLKDKIDYALEGIHELKHSEEKDFPPPIQVTRFNAEIKYKDWKKTKKFGAKRYRHPAPASWLALARELKVYELELPKNSYDIVLNKDIEREVNQNNLISRWGKKDSIIKLRKDFQSKKDFFKKNIWKKKNGLKKFLVCVYEDIPWEHKIILTWLGWIRIEHSYKRLWRKTLLKKYLRKLGYTLYF